jgi:hypothetical protein
MTVIRTPQRYANRRMAENVREAFQTVGELCIFIQMRHVFVEDADTEDPTHSPRCPRCWDPFYKESTDMACEVCGGTGLSPDATSRGIRQFGRAWCVISDNKAHEGEMIRKYGQWEEDDREIQLEGGANPDDHDYLVRVSQWSSDYRPLVLDARFRLINPGPESVRSGNEFGQSSNNLIGWKMQGKRVRNFDPFAKFDFPSDTPIPRFV